MDIHRKFSFEAAHMIPALQPGHPCGRLHGHTYYVEIWLRAELPDGKPWFFDWGDLDLAIELILKDVDHRYLNEVPGLEVPSCENLAKYIWDVLEGSCRVPHLYKIKIEEGARSGLEYYGD